MARGLRDLAPVSSHANVDPNTTLPLSPASSNRTRPDPTIFLVEDDESVAMMISDVLRADGYSIWHARNGDELAGLIDQIRPDLIVLDLRLPDANGLVLCAELREKTDAQILVCSGTKREDDLVLAFKLGADDFVRKPVAVGELIARIKAALRRGAHKESKRAPTAGEAQIRAVGDLTIDAARCQASVNGQVIRLTPIEYRLLDSLARRENEVVPTAMLCTEIWGSSGAGTHQALGVHIRRLRSKIRAASTSATVVASRGFGYRLVCIPESNSAH